MNNLIPVSVIIPCYNCDKTIERAMNSILKQTYIPDEIILIEDCSPDNGKTKEKLYGIQKEYNGNVDIKVIILEENKGPANARNVGWDNASNEFIAFLDADDSWHKQKLEIQYNIMIGNKEFVMSGHKSTYRASDSIEKEITRNVFPLKSFNKINFFLSNKFPTRSVMLRRNLEYRFFPEKKYSEDFLLWSEIFLNGHKICLIDEVLAYSYENDFGTSGLTSHLFKMQYGVIETYLILNQRKLITNSIFVLLCLLQVFKFTRRLLNRFLYKFLLKIKK